MFYDIFKFSGCSYESLSVLESLFVFIFMVFCISKKIDKVINHRDNNDDHYKSIFGPGFSSDMAYRPSSTYPGLE